MLPIKQTNKALPAKGKIIDLGCGQGITAGFLARGKARTVIGVDLNKNRLAKSKLKNLKFVHGDIRTYNTKGASGILISDVLHHLSFNDQDAILKNITKNSDKGLVLVIKEIDSKEFVRSKLSRLWDLLFYPKDKIYYQDSSRLTDKLKKMGFTVEVLRTIRFFPGSTTLYICRKK